MVISTILPATLFAFGMTYDIVPARMFGIIGVAMFWQMFYGTVVYFFQYFHAGRHVGQGRGALTRAKVRPEDLSALGITNQRETTVVWDRATGRPIHPAIVWQSRQTAPLCEEMKRRGLAPMVRERTGLVIDAYFSATKLAFILEAVDGARERSRRAAGSVSARR